MISRGDRVLAFACTLHASGVLASSAVQPEWAGYLLVLELAGLAFWLRSARGRAAWPFALALVGVLRLAAAVHFRFPFLAEDLSAIGHGLSGLLPVLTWRVVWTSLQSMGAATGLWTLAAVLIGAGVYVLVRRRPEQLARLPLYLAVPAVALTFFQPVERIPRMGALDGAMARVQHDFERLELARVAPLPELPRVDGPDVFLVVLESVGRENLARHVENHPDCVFARLFEHGVHVPSVVATANASHLAQPSLLTSHDFTRRPTPTLSAEPPPHGLLTMPAYFRAKGYRTLMVSSQDERWLGMDRITLQGPWDLRLHSPDAFAGPQSLYRDACGVEKVLDSHTVDRFVREVESVRGGAPVFAYLNLQNTHFPFVLEDSPPNPRLPEALCSDFASMPEDRLEEFADRYDLALRETERRLLRVREAFPDALLVVTGDHGESFVAGKNFGHAKSLAEAEMTTFALFHGAGLEPARVDAPASSLDLLPTVITLVDPADHDRLPAALLSGRSLRGTDGWSREGPVFVGSHGFGAEFAAVLGEVKVRYMRSRPERCSRLDDQDLEAEDPRCVETASALVDWLSCQTQFYDRRRTLSYLFYNPCFSGLGSEFKVELAAGR